MCENNEINKIQVKEGEEHNSRVMNIYDDSAFFLSSYQQAAQAVTAIVKQSREFYRMHKPGDLPLGNNSDRFEYHNNIVAFCAERGQGKTSAMLSMAEALRRITYPGCDRDFWNNPSIKLSEKDGDNPVLNTRFELLGVVDPTCMETKDSLIRTIISKMYKSASDKWRECVNRPSGGEYHSKYKEYKEKLAKKFLTCFKGIDYLYRDKNELSVSYDDLTMLAEYGDSNNFKDSFHELVQVYLEFMAIESGQAKSMLVIPIDDADLNPDNAYSIMEEIRKYCILPNILVFMALHIGTLSRTIEQYFLKQYETLITQSRDQSIRERCHRAMERYIDKLLPASHRVNLTPIDNFLRDEYDRFSLSYIDKGNQEKFVADSRLTTKKVTTYQEQLIMLIYQKTGIILCKPDYYLHEFLPGNMRELNHFLYYFTRLKNVITVDEKDHICGTVEDILSCYKGVYDKKWRSTYGQIVRLADDRLHNLEQLENYFLNTWCPLRLNSLQIKVIENMHKSTRKAKNRRTIDLLKDYCKNESIALPKFKEQADLPDNYVPFSDVVYTLHLMERAENSQESISLVYAVRMYYTIYFHKITLNGIKSWFSQDRSQKTNTALFGDLLALTGYRLFPLEYYRAKRLPELIFHCEGESLNEEIQKTVFKHYLCDAKDKDSGYVKVFNRACLTDIPAEHTFRLTSEFQYFDYFRPIITLLGIEDFHDKVFVKNELPLSVVGSCLRMICNLDIQALLYQRYFSIPGVSVKSSDDKRTGIVPYDMICGIYDEVDKAIAEGSIVNRVCSIKAFVENEDGKQMFSVDNFAVLDSQDIREEWRYSEDSDKVVVTEKYNINEIEITRSDPSVKDEQKAEIKGELLTKPEE